MWNALNVLNEASKAYSMAAATLAHGSPYWKEIQQAENAEKTATELDDYYASLNVLKTMPSKERGDPEWNSPYDLYQLQLTFLLMEQHLYDALRSIKVTTSPLIAAGITA